MIWWRNEKARPKNFNAVSHNHVRSKLLFPHCQNVTDHLPCLPNFLLLNAKSKSWSRTDEICPRDHHVKFKNNTSGRKRLWDTALKFLCQGHFITSPDHLDMFTDQTWAAIYQYDRASCACAKHQEFLFFRFACEAYTSTTEWKHSVIWSVISSLQITSTI